MSCYCQNRLRGSSYLIDMMRLRAQLEQALPISDGRAVPRAIDRRPRQSAYAGGSRACTPSSRSEGDNPKQPRRPNLQAQGTALRGGPHRRNGGGVPHSGGRVDPRRHRLVAGSLPVKHSGGHVFPLSPCYRPARVRAPRIGWDMPRRFVVEAGFCSLVFWPARAEAECNAVRAAVTTRAEAHS